MRQGLLTSTRKIDAIRRHLQSIDLVDVLVLSGKRFADRCRVAANITFFLQNASPVFEIFTKDILSKFVLITKN